MVFLCTIEVVNVAWELPGINRFLILVQFVPPAKIKSTSAYRPALFPAPVGEDA